MRKAIFTYQGKQFAVSEGDLIEVNGPASINESDISVDEVSLVISDDNVILGNPNVKDALITLSPTGDTLSKKLSVRRFKAKSRYRRNKGIKLIKNILRVNSITVEGENYGT